MRNRNKYPKNWQILSLRFRIRKGRKCFKCGKIGSRKKPNCTDHINGVKSDCAESNLMVLCPRCHLIKGIKSGEIKPDILAYITQRSFKEFVKCSLHLTGIPKHMEH